MCAETCRRDAGAYERFAQATEWPMLVLSLAFLPIIGVPLVFETSPSVAAMLEAAAWIIWAAFAAEYCIKLYLAPDRGRMVRTHVPDLVIIVLPFLRPLRALRLLRLVGAATAMGRAGLAAKRLLTRRGFSTFLLMTLAVIVVAGLATWAFERGDGSAQITSPVDGVWWALVTSTTVGYGDMVPVTPEGRGVAVGLMLVGIALLSVVTANIAAFFVEEGDAAQVAELRAEIRDLREELATLRATLVAAHDARGSGSSPPQPHPQPLDRRADQTNR